MQLAIDLHDYDGNVHSQKECLIDDEATVDQLKKEVQSLFNIEPAYQDLFFKNVRLRFGTLVAVGLKNQDTVIVKHSLLGIWIAYLENCKSANVANISKPERTTYAHNAIKYSNVLGDSKFFIAYIKFGGKYRETIGQMIRTPSAFKQSATTFFSKKYPNSKIDFQLKPGGTRAGVVVMVTWNDQHTKYFMKTYHHAGTSASLQNTAKRHLPDLREMLAYRLLHLIEVGPAVFFPFYAGSTHIYFIATEEISEFKDLEKIEDGNVQKKIVVEAFLLSLILGIRDLNEGNFGINKEKSLSIVDFYVPDHDNFQRRKILEGFKEKSNFGGFGKAIEILSEIGPEERVRIARDALPRWSRINDVTSEIIGAEKGELREHGIKFGTAINDVDQYVEDIKGNFASIRLALQ